MTPLTVRSKSAGSSASEASINTLEADKVLMSMVNLPVPELIALPLITVFAASSPEPMRASPAPRSTVELTRLVKISRRMSPVLPLRSKRIFLAVLTL